MQTVCTAIAGLGINCESIMGTPAQLESAFNTHIAEHGLSYGTKEEYNFRLALFTQKDQELNEINSDPSLTYIVAHNMFSTMTKDEQARYRGRLPRVAPADEVVEELETVGLPTAIDWRKKGAVNPVQNQGQCGSCWAFSSTAAMEGAHFLATGKLLKLAEQQFVDCDPNSDGCNGGLEMYAFEYAEKHAQELETAYPYTARTGRKCKATATAEKAGVKAKSFVHVPKKSVSAIKAAVAAQPTCVSVDAESSHFMNYSGGILNTKRCGHQLDHAVTAVGYGVENGQEYLIVRNSWGPSWGEKGYIRMSLEVGGAGVCGVLLDSTRPTTF